MSKKVTESMLKGLIQEVLNEERLNDFAIPIKIDPKGRKKITTKFGLDDEEFKSITGKPTFPKAAEIWKSIAKADGEKNLIEPVDFEKAFSVPKGYSTRTNLGKARALADKIYDASNDKPSFKAYGGQHNPEGPPDPVPLAGRLGTEFGLTDQSTAAEFGTAADGFLDLIKNYSKLKTIAPLHKDFVDAIKNIKPTDYVPVLDDANKRFKDLVDKYPEPLGQMPKTPDSVKNSPTMNIANSGITIDDKAARTMLPFGDVNTSGQYDSSKTINSPGMDGAVTVDSSIQNMLSAVSGSNLAEKLSSLNNSAIILNDPAKIKSLSPQESFELSNNIAILSTIGNLAKSTGSSSAGFELEGIFAGLLLGFKPAGNGTSDMITKIKDGEAKFYSSKFVSTTATQSWNGEEGKNNGMRHHLAKGDVYYITIKKTGSTTATTSATAYNKLEVHITKLIKTSDKLPVWVKGKEPWVTVDGAYLNPDGNFYALEPPLGKKAADGSPPIKHGANPYITIALLKNANASAFAIGDKIIKAVEGADNPLLKAIMNASRRLKNMDDNTKEYRAARGSGKDGELSTGSATATDYVKQIATDYSEIKKNFGAMFSDDEKRAAKVDGAQVFTEQKVTANLLQKLISETFKK
jgi:hypothetical protein